MKKNSLSRQLAGPGLPAAHLKPPAHTKEIHITRVVLLAHLQSAEK